MAVCTLTTSKGGTAKTTTSILLGTQLAHMGLNVVMINADRSNRSMMIWAEKQALPDNIKIIEDAEERNLQEIIDRENKENTFVVVDLEGIASNLQYIGIAAADFVIVPMCLETIDFEIAKNTVQLIEKIGKMNNRQIAHALAITRTKTRSEDFLSTVQREIWHDILNGEIPFLFPFIATRAAYANLFKYGGDLHSMPKSGDMSKAQENVDDFVNSLIDHMERADNDGQA